MSTDITKTQFPLYPLIVEIRNESIYTDALKFTLTDDSEPSGSNTVEVNQNSVVILTVHLKNLDSTNANASVALPPMKGAKAETIFVSLLHKPKTVFYAKSRKNTSQLVARYIQKDIETVVTLSPLAVISNEFVHRSVSFLIDGLPTAPIPPENRRYQAAPRISVIAHFTIPEVQGSEGTTKGPSSGEQQQQQQQPSPAPTSSSSMMEAVPGAPQPLAPSGEIILRVPAIFGNQTKETTVRNGGAILSSKQDKWGAVTYTLSVDQNIPNSSLAIVTKQTNDRHKHHRRHVKTVYAPLSPQTIACLTFALVFYVLFVVFLVLYLFERDARL
jgi:hypothetical protein